MEGLGQGGHGVPNQLPIDGVALEPLAAPTVLDGGAWSPIPSHLYLSPDKRISLYHEGEWEEFVLEWATTLEYAQVMRGGGTGDHGVDVAGFGSELGFDGEWDCYQCKHYGKPLQPADAYAEILKIVLGTIDDHYTWPRRYRFAAPRGCGTSLSGIIHSPSKLQTGFADALSKINSPLAKHLGAHSLDSVLKFVGCANFEVFGTVELHELVEQHAKTRWHSARFGVELPTRPAARDPEPEPTIEEQRYIAKLLTAYSERHGEPFTVAHAANHEGVGRHYVRQRIAFYSAESLRVFARDSVPDGTFAALQEEIFDGVVDIHDLPHSDGLERLGEVTRGARALSITANGLLPIVNVRDRTGICHQLANDDRLSWCDADSE
jgi:hypothetical protein